MHACVCIVTYTHSGARTLARRPPKKGWAIPSANLGCKRQKINMATERILETDGRQTGGRGRDLEGGFTMLCMWFQIHIQTCVYVVYKQRPWRELSVIFLGEWCAWCCCACCHTHKVGLVITFGVLRHSLKLLIKVCAFAQDAHRCCCRRWWPKGLLPYLLHHLLALPPRWLAAPARTAAGRQENKNNDNLRAYNFWVGQAVSHYWRKMCVCLTLCLYCKAITRTAQKSGWFLWI